MNEPLNNAADEVAAAEAELRAAQEKLEAAKAKLAVESAPEEGAAEDVTQEAPGEEAEEAGEAVAEEAGEDAESAPTGDQAAHLVAGEPVAVAEAVGVEEVVAVEEAEAAEPVAAEAATAPCDECPPRPAQVAEPDWVPYSTAQSAPPPAAQPQQPSAAPVPPQPGASYVPPANGYTAPTYQQPPHAGPGAVPPQQPYYGYQQPYYQQPYSQPIVSTKDHVAAGLLAIFLGALGIHKFYLGYNTAGFIMLAVTILGSLVTFGLASAVMGIIGIIEGILYLTKSQTEFEQIYVLNKRDWF